MGGVGPILSKRALRRDSRLSTFVSVGNATQPFGRLLRAIPPLVGRLPRPVLVQYGNNTFEDVPCEAVRFVNMDRFARCVASSRLLIMHAGAGSVIHALQAGKVPVVVPRRSVYGELVDDHQLEFARALANMGKVVLCEDVAELAAAARQALALQAERQERQMSVPPLVAALAGELSQYSIASA